MIFTKGIGFKPIPSINIFTMKKLFFILLLYVVLFSCRKDIKPTDPIPENTTFLDSLVKTTYYENAEVKLFLKIFPFKHETDLSLDWGDGRVENEHYIIDHNSSNTNTILQFTHKYIKNGTYKVYFKAINRVTKDSLTTYIKITNKLPNPVADFSYELLENGKVKFKNLSSDTLYYNYWGDTKTQSRSFLVNPIFIYDRNDTYRVFLSIRDKYNQYTDIEKDIRITNAPPRELASFKGIIFDKPYEFNENNEDCLTTLSETVPVVTDIMNAIGLYNKERSLEIKIGGTFQTLSSGNPEFNIQERYKKFRQHLTPGIKKVNNQGIEEHWNAYIRYQTTNDSDFKLKLFNEDPNAYIEIIDVKEIDQPPLFDTLYPKSFWVTFKLKADFKEAGKVDGILKMRYLVHRL